NTYTHTRTHCTPSAPHITHTHQYTPTVQGDLRPLGGPDSKSVVMPTALEWRTFPQRAHAHTHTHTHTQTRTHTHTHTHTPGLLRPHPPRCGPGERPVRCLETAAPV